MYQFKTEAIQVGTTRYQVKELSALAVKKFMDANEKNVFEAMAVTCQEGCDQFASMTVEDILNSYPQHVLNELSGAILKLSGLQTEDEDEKKD